MQNRVLAALLLPIAADASYCSWRQTAGCDPDGVREPHGDRGCAAVIARGMSGFCECADGSRAGAVTCEHPPFACNSVCGDSTAALRREAEARAAAKFAETQPGADMFVVHVFNLVPAAGAAELVAVSA